jgi:hypothetical protein
MIVKLQHYVVISIVILIFIQFYILRYNNYDKSQSIHQSVNDYSSIYVKSISIVIASRGGKNNDDELEENFSWLPKAFNINNVKKIYKYQRRDVKEPYYIATESGYECLTYIRYIVDNYNNLPDAVIFIHADAQRHCPFIQTILLKRNNEIITELLSLNREISGYIPLSKVYLNQTKKHVMVYNYNMVPFVNDLMMNLYNNTKHNIIDYPLFTTTYIAGSFIIHKNNILKYNITFYQNMLSQLYDINCSTLKQINKYDLRMCGKLEYLWSTMWGGLPPLENKRDSNRWCGPLYTTDISIDGFLFVHSENGIVERGEKVEGYN